MTNAEHLASLKAEAERLEAEELEAKEKIAALEVWMERYQENWRSVSCHAVEARTNYERALRGSRK